LTLKKKRKKKKKKKKKKFKNSIPKETKVGKQLPGRFASQLTSAILYVGGFSMFGKSGCGLTGQSLLKIKLEVFSLVFFFFSFCCRNSKKGNST
jgi:hypothetical protein